MAKNRDNENPVADPEESQVMDQADTRRPAQPSRPAPAGKGINLFSMFKPLQGKQIRLWTAIGVGLLLLGAWLWMFPKFQVSFTGSREWMAAAVAGGICAVVGLVTWFFVGVNRTTVDFLIATESEMKKVTWSSRKEVWGATKVVIGMVIFLSVGLFVVDLFFTWFFTKIGVLKTPF
jgi:preprotein translocase subunit SecE